MGSLVVFSVEVGRLAAFYEDVLGLTAEQDRWGGIRLRGEGTEILVHPVPAEIAKTIVIQIPPEPLEGAAIKPVFNVGSLDIAVETAMASGGSDTGRAFSIDGFTMRDVIDPDGNVIQFRAQLSHPPDEA